MSPSAGARKLVNWAVGSNPKPADENADLVVQAVSGKLPDLVNETASSGWSSAGRPHPRYRSAPLWQPLEGVGHDQAGGVTVALSIPV
jgi:hypothetical protein